MSEARRLRAEADAAHERGDRDECARLHAQARRVEERDRREAGFPERRTPVATSDPPPSRRTPHSVSLIVLPEGATIMSYLTPEETASLGLIFETIGQNRWKVVKNRGAWPREGDVLTSHAALGEAIHQAMRS